MDQETRKCPDAANTRIPKLTLPAPIQALGFLQAQNYQALDDLQQLLHDHSNALVAQEATDGLEVRWPHKVAVGAVDVAVGDVERLGNCKHSDSQTGPSTRPVVLLSQCYVSSLQMIFKEEEK